MAAVTTFNSLVADMILYAERANDSVFVAEVPKLIALAENRIARDVKGLGQQQVATDSFLTNNPIILKPDRWRETVSMNYGTGTGNNTRNFVLARSLEFCRFYWPDQTQVAPPKYYADYDYGHWLLAGTPDQAYPFEVIYYERAIPLDAANQQNWNTTYAPDLLLAACMLQCQPFLKNIEKMQVWQGMFDQYAQSFSKEDKRRSADRSTIVDKG